VKFFKEKILLSFKKGKKIFKTFHNSQNFKFPVFCNFIFCCFLEFFRLLTAVNCAMQGSEVLTGMILMQMRRLNFPLEITERDGTRVRYYSKKIFLKKNLFKNGISHKLFFSFMFKFGVLNFNFFPPDSPVVNSRRRWFEVADFHRLPVPLVRFRTIFPVIDFGKNINSDRECLENPFEISFF
jgi:hypothetical protein